MKELNTAYRKQIELVREENNLKLQVNIIQVKQLNQNVFFYNFKFNIFYLMCCFVYERKFEVSLANGSVGSVNEQKFKVPLTL